MIAYNYTIIKTVYNFTYLYTRAVVNAWSVHDHSKKKKKKLKKK